MFLLLCASYIEMLIVEQHQNTCSMITRSSYSHINVVMLKVSSHWKVTFSVERKIRAYVRFMKRMSHTWYIIWMAHGLYGCRQLLLLHKIFHFSLKPFTPWAVMRWAGVVVSLVGKHCLRQWYKNKEEIIILWTLDFDW